MFSNFATNLDMIMEPCMSSCNSISFWVFMLSEKYLSNTSTLKCSQSLGVPKEVILAEEFIHHIAASPLNIWVSQTTLPSSKHGVTSKTLLMIVSQSWSLIWFRSLETLTASSGKTHKTFYCLHSTEEVVGNPTLVASLAS